VPGYRLDRYELLGPLAEGGMASVWIARQRGKHGFEKLVAVKTILPQFAADLRFQKMFLDEARVASRIEHFNVARILDLGEEHDVLYLVMEYVDGDSLSKLRRACRDHEVVMPIGIMLRILADACSGLHEAHELRGEDGKLLEVVHRDVSPHNILVSTKGVAKVIDFGIAKARDRLAGETNAGVLKGKIQYMAPEQALGRVVDRRADLWALGASLYHLITGKPPFDAENTLGTLHLLTSGRPPMPLPPTVHPSIAAIARKALTNPPEKRFQTAAEMRDAMEAAMIDARVPATSADVGAFVVEQLSERTAKRRQIIDIAIAAAAERERVEQVLKPNVEQTGSGVTPPSGPPPASARTAPDMPGAMRRPEALMSAAMAPGLPDSWPEPPSAAPVETHLSDPVVVPRSRRTPVVIGATIAVLIVAGSVALATLREPALVAHSVPVSSGLAVTGTPSASASAAPPAAPSEIPVIAWTELPKADEPPTTPPPPHAGPHVAPPPPPGRPTTTAAPSSAPARRRSIDDGF
jgi:eukaryotic-like serine/threonine-protein kinase